eukprot:5712267-Amphidinium_carterae.1
MHIATSSSIAGRKNKTTLYCFVMLESPCEAEVVNSPKRGNSPTSRKSSHYDLHNQRGHDVEPRPPPPQFGKAPPPSNGPPQRLKRAKLENALVASAQSSPLRR